MCAISSKRNGCNFRTQHVRDDEDDDDDDGDDADVDLWGAENSSMRQQHAHGAQNATKKEEKTPNQLLLLILLLLLLLVVLLLLLQHPPLNTLRVTQYVHPHPCLWKYRYNPQGGRIACTATAFNDPSVQAAALRLRGEPNQLAY